MKTYETHEEFFHDFENLIRRFEKAGHYEESKSLRDGFACLNGLTDGWALFLESIEEVISNKKCKIPSEELTELAEMLEVVKSTVFRK